MEAFHLEGPYISPARWPARRTSRAMGASARSRRVSALSGSRSGHIRLVTLSPEWPEAPRFIEKIVEKGVVASIGHTRASSLPDCRRCQRRRDAIHASGQWRRCRAAKTPITFGSSLPTIASPPALSSMDSISAVVPECRAARQGSRAVAAGHRCRYARRLSSRRLQLGRSRTSNCTRRQCPFGWRLASGWFRTHMDRAIANVMRTAGLT